MTETVVEPALAGLVERARRLVVPGERRVLGIAGPPGSGKSTLAASLVAALGPEAAALLPMDGFHRSNDELAALGLRDWKGAPETFDAEGYIAMLSRVRASFGSRVLVPGFDRHAEATVPDTLEVPAGVPLAVAEGNYLLLDEAPWRSIRALLDAAWFLRGDSARVPRLINRHVEHGRTRDAALEWVMRNDERNATRVAPGAARADLVVEGLATR